jgi:hypothetical protein
MLNPCARFLATGGCIRYPAVMGHNTMGKEPKLPASKKNLMGDPLRGTKDDWP